MFHVEAGTAQTSWATVRASHATPPRPPRSPVRSRVMARPPSPLTTFIRSLPADLPVKDVIAQAKAAGHETSESNVSRVRADMAKATPKKPASTSKERALKKAASRRKAASKEAAPKKAPKEPMAPGTAKSAGVSKSAFIRLHPSLSAAEVIAAGKDQGLTFTSSLVYAVRGAQDGKKTTAKKTAPKKTSATKTGAKKTSTASSKTAPPKKTATSAKTASTKTATSTKPAETKADFVRARAHLSPKEIVEDAKSQGVKLDPSYVYGVRGYDQVKASKKQSASKKNATTTASKKATPPTSTSSKTTTSNGTRPTGSASSVEELLRAVAAEIGLGRATEILAGERARVRAVMGT